MNCLCQNQCHSDEGTTLKTWHMMPKEKKKKTKGHNTLMIDVKD